MHPYNEGIEMLEYIGAFLTHLEYLIQNKFKLFCRLFLKKGVLVRFIGEATKSRFSFLLAFS